MFDQMSPKMVGIISSSEWESEAQVVSMNSEDDGVVKLEFRVDTNDIELYLKLAHLQVALNEMIQKHNQIVKSIQTKSPVLEKRKSLD